jgi:TPR repeat protein
MFRTSIGVLCFCLAVPASAKIGESVPQLVQRFGKNYTVEPDSTGKRYKFRSQKFSVDVIVSNNVSVAETYFSGHPLAANGEPPTDIVRAILKTNVQEARWLEIEAAPFSADYALRSSDQKYVAILRYKGPQPESSVWTMTVGLGNAIGSAKTATAGPVPADTLGPTSAPATGPAKPVSLSSDLTPQEKALLDKGAVMEMYKPDEHSGHFVSHVDAVKDVKTEKPRKMEHPEPILCFVFGIEDAEPARKEGESMAEFHYSRVQAHEFLFAQGWDKYHDRFFTRCYVQEGEDAYDKTAVEQGNPDAQVHLAQLYQEGRGVPQDYRKAVELYEKAAAQGNALAQVNLGWLYHEGKGVPQDYHKAAELYQKSADQGNAAGQAYLASQYAEGKGVARDYRKAVELYRRAVEGESSPNALNDFAWFLATCPDDAWRNGKEAVRYATKACETTEWKSRNFVGTLAAAYAELGDFDKAIKYQKQAIELAGDYPDDAEMKRSLTLYEQHKPFRSLPALISK